MYETLDIPTSSSRPWVYANFVMTLDGKTAVGSLQKSYWPIGSTVDFEAMRHLRMQADLLVHGRKTACFYPTLHRLRVPSFQEARRAHGRDPHLAYAVVSEQARDELAIVVNQLEAGTTTLEESLALWERGEKLVAICEQWLSNARERIEAVRRQSAVSSD